MFRALRYRQEIKFRHDCFANAIGAADYRNAHRLESNDKVWSPLDYVVCEGGEQDTNRDEAKRNIASIYCLIGSLTPEQAAKQKEKVIHDLTKQGFDDAEELFKEIFPEG
jgi:hypothetical protein